MLIPGLFIGLAGGALPGISGAMILALMLPVTPYMDFFTAIVFLISVFTGAGFGGAVPAILMNKPGSTAAVATTFDGFPARAGRHNEALGLELAASTIGTMISYAVLFLLISFVATAVLKLGPVEMAVVAVWGITMIAMLHGGNLERGILAGVFGLLIGTIGICPTGRMRGTFGMPELIDGIAVVPAIIGMLATAELFNLARSKYIIANEADRVVSVQLIMKGFRTIIGYRRTHARGSLIGIFVGAVPGAGASDANLVSYAIARRGDPEPDSFGKGNPKGLVASEAANSSSEGGAMDTLLALGLPGGGGTAVLLAAFAMQNVTGGSPFTSDHSDIVYGILIANMAQSLLLIIVVLLFIRVVVVIIKVEVRHLVPTVIVVAMAGSYAITGNLTRPITLAVFSLIGWDFARYDYAPAAAVVGLLLGGRREPVCVLAPDQRGADQFHFRPSHLADDDRDPGCFEDLSNAVQAVSETATHD